MGNHIDPWFMWDCSLDEVLGGVMAVGVAGICVGVWTRLVGRAAQLKSSLREEWYLGRGGRGEMGCMGTRCAIQQLPEI